VTAYRELLARLLPARRFGVVLGLHRMRALLDRLGAPDRRLGEVVHVGGTNGKGSTVAMIAALAAGAGRRVATYTSPHLTSLRERIVIDGEMIGEDALVAAADRVRAAGGDELTFFEQITAIAMVAIADAGVDVSVLEVGLGGRLDATNVVDAPIAVVTGVALDHEAVLGRTLDAIAREKAGIFKPGRHAVIGVSGDPAAVPTLVQAAAEVGARAVVVDPLAPVPPLGLAGAHQRRNAAAALAAIDQLGLPVVPAALATIRHPGRFEVIDGAPRIVLDGAHNPHGARALADALAGFAPVVLVIAVSSDKDVAGIARELVPVASAVIATRYAQPRALDPDLITRAFAGVPAETAPDLANALAVARARAGTTSVVVVAGSLFLVGEARVLLCGAKADPFVVTDPAP
jgi:dihydrofolate synthase/folylpolyglutamate synthase